jgi:hypothetical protein
MHRHALSALLADRARSWLGQEILADVHNGVMAVTPGLPAEIVAAFVSQCSAAHDAWAIHRALFDDNESLEELSSVGCYDVFFQRLNPIAQEYALQQICQLHDPARQGDKTNLTLDYIVRHGGWDPETLSTLRRLKAQLDSFEALLRDARNKRLSHIDLSAATDSAALGQFEEGEDRKYFQRLEQFVRIVDGHSFEFANFAEGDVRAFLEVCLRDVQRRNQGQGQGRAFAYDHHMASTTIAVGVALIIVGVAGYFLTGMVSLTALIPAVFGTVLALCGLTARDERKRKHAMHAAVVIALLGFAGSVRGLMHIGDVLNGTAARPAAVIAQTIMAVLMLGYLVLAIRSFAAARQSRP